MLKRLIETENPAMLLEGCSIGVSHSVQLEWVFKVLYMLLCFVVFVLGPLA
jgi:hypothetical protein